MKTARFSLLPMFCLLSVGHLHALGDPPPPFRVVALDASRNGVANVPDGPFLQDLRESLRLGGSHAPEYIPLATFAPGSLGGDPRPDLVMVHNAFDGASSMPVPLSASERTELRRYVEEEGGSLLIILDAYFDDPAAVASANAILGAFEMELALSREVCTGFTPVADPSEHPVTDGPYGVVDRILLLDGSWLASLGPHATGLIDHPESGEPVVAIIDRGELAPGSGRVLVVTDANCFADADLGASFYFPKHEAFFRNAVAWLTAPCIPETVVTREIVAVDPIAGDGFRPGDRFTVRIQVDPPSSPGPECTPDPEDESRVVLVERVPLDWTVEEESISNDADLVINQSIPDVIYWRFPVQEFQEPLTVSYTAVAGSSLEDAEFRGSLYAVPWSPVSVSVRGDRTVRPRWESPLRIAALDESRNDYLSFIDSVIFADLRASLATRAPELGFDGVELLPLTTLSEEALSEVHLLLLSNRTAEHCPLGFDLSPVEQEALRGFVENGGAALIVVESRWDTSPSLLAPFEVTLAPDFVNRVDDHNSIPDPGAHPVTSGPFGEVSRVTTAWPGWFSDLGRFASPIARLQAGGQPFLAGIDAGALGEGSGRVFFSADSHSLGDVPWPENYWYFNTQRHEELFLNTIAWLLADSDVPEFRRGDGNDDGSVDIADPVYVLNHLFGGGPAPSCMHTADANDDNAVDIADPVYQLNHLFGGGPPLPAPVGECGTDPTPAANAEDDLSCDGQPPCE